MEKQIENIVRNLVADTIIIKDQDVELCLKATKKIMAIAEKREKEVFDSKNVYWELNDCDDDFDGYMHIVSTVNGREIKISIAEILKDLKIKKPLATKLGGKQSPEVKRKISQSIKEHWIQRKSTLSIKEENK